MENHRGYEGYEFSTCKILISLHVIFKGNISLFSKLNASTTVCYYYFFDNDTPFLTPHEYISLPPKPPLQTTPNEPKSLSPNKTCATSYY